MTTKKTKTVAARATGTAATKQEDAQKVEHGGVAKQGEIVTTTRNQVELPPGLSLEEIDNYGGAGTSQKAEDNVVPLVYILQSNSPQVGSRNPEYIQDAAPGDIWLRNAPVPVIDGELGIVVQPCFFAKHIVEWVPRSAGGGFVASHADMPSDAEEYTHPETGAKKLRRKSNGNDLVETRYHGVLIDGAPYIIPFSSTGHTVSRGWMQLMNNFKLPSGKTAPSWLHRYRLTTKVRSNKAGEWFVFNVAHLGPVATADEFREGEMLFKMLSSGEKIVGEPDEQNERGVEDKEIPF
jgi:hypothetical protein